jgi:hypothetical protein
MRAQITGQIGTAHRRYELDLGAFIEMQEGLHRVEIFQTAPGTGPYDSSPKSGGFSYVYGRTSAR